MQTVNAIVVVCHPNERSFCHAIAGEAARTLEAAGCEVMTHDLYVEAPDPVLSGAEIARRTPIDPQIQRYAAEIHDAATLVIVHPDWWGGPPALLKGWVDRVFRPGVAYDWDGAEFEEKSHSPLLAHVGLHVFVTSDRDDDEPIETVSNVWKEVSRYSGMLLRTLRVFSRMRERGIRTRRAYLSEIEQLLVKSD